MCDYTPYVHFTAQADEYHMSTCVASKMKRMADPNECVRYMSGIAGPSLGQCSVNDLEAICEAKTADFTVADAHKLCAYENAATAKFWSERNQLQH